jgi:uncharacterized SAM-dependent methyltransferase
MLGTSIGSYYRTEAEMLSMKIYDTMKSDDILLMTCDLRKDYKVIL